ncbi:MAG TPA: hypothetical protein VIN40_03840 [Candidatus Tyrphobacter sp.]
MNAVNDISGLLFTLYYMAVTSFWLVNVINALVGKAVERVLRDPAHSRRHGLVVHLWQFIYTASAIAGLVLLASCVNYWSWLDWLYCIAWGLFMFGSFATLTKRYDNAEAENEFLQVLNDSGKST